MMHTHNRQSITGNSIEDESLVTVIDGAAGHDITSAWLEHTLDGYLQEDDVIKSDFFATILLVGEREFDSREIETRWGRSKVHRLHLQDTEKISPGPCIVHGGLLWQVLRLYEDVQKTFVSTLRQASDGR